MVEPLAVDPARLTAAAGKLTELVFPAPPAPIAASGTDPMSAAINATMPGIESLVSDGLPGVTAALQRTAASMGTAADIYTKADLSLGQAMAQYGFGGDGQSFGASASAAMSGQSDFVGAQTLGAPAAAAAAAGVAPQLGAALAAQAEALAPQLQATVPQLVQLAPLAQQMAPMGQQVGQSVQQAASQGSQGASSAQLAGDTKPDEDKKDDENQDGSDGPTPDGAAAGQATLVSAPVAGAGGGKPDAGATAAPV